MNFYKTSIWSKSYRLAHFKTWSNKSNTNFLHYKVQTIYCEILGLHSMASSYHFNLIFNYFFIILRYTNCCVHCSALFWYWYTCLACSKSWIFWFWEVKNALLRANEIKNNIHKKNNASHIVSLHWNFFFTSEYLVKIWMLDTTVENQYVAYILLWLSLLFLCTWKCYKSVFGLVSTNLKLRIKKKSLSV